jgi:hypothetical protein
MSVPRGTLDTAYREAVLAFYGETMGWREMEDLRLPDRLTIAVGDRCYVNVRERDEPMHSDGYVHVGFTLDSPEGVDALWEDLRARPVELELTPVKRGQDGYRSFRFRHLLPLAIEVQHFPW